MKILRAVGLGLVILILQFLVPKIFAAMEGAVIAFFHSAQTTFEASQTAVVYSMSQLSH